MKYFVIMLLLLSNYSYANADMCNRSFEAYITEKGRGKLPNKMQITMKEGKLYLANSQIRPDMYVFTYLIRYHQGEMYSGYSKPLNDIHLVISDGNIQKKILAVWVTDDKHITIADFPKKTGPSFSNMSFDQNGNIFQLALSMEVKDNCEVYASAELLTGKYRFESGVLVVNTDNSYFTMKGPKIDL